MKALVCCLLVLCFLYDTEGGGKYHKSRHHKRHRHHHREVDSSSDDDSAQKAGHHYDPEDRVWYFQIGHDFGAYEYLDSAGVLQGFHVDLLNAVCKKAHKHCHTIVDIESHCWDTDHHDEVPGEGLLDSYYDSCLGWDPTPERKNSFQFSKSFTETTKAALYVRENEEKTYSKNLQGTKIGFLKGSAEGIHCLARQKGFQGNTIGAAGYTDLMYETHEELVAALANKEVDMIFSEDAYNATAMASKPLFSWVTCSTGGHALMARFGDHVLPWWNKAFDQVVKSGIYSNLCVEAEKKHKEQGEVHCIKELSLRSLKQSTTRET